MINYNQPGNLGSLCTKCLRLFQGHHVANTWSVHFSPQEISLIDPKYCRICSLIQSRLKRFVNDKERLGRVVSLHEIRYIFAPRTEEPKGLTLYIGLFYGVRKNESIRIELLSTNETNHVRLTQDLPSNTGSEASIEFLKSKFQECRESHSNCRRRSDLTPRSLPSRLLEIGSDRQTVYLRNQNELRFEPYFTLSHCWGEQKPFQLTQATEASLMAGLPIECLPKTFRDAIFIANKFSVAYIWIDSLCIYQDNIEDWYKEASTMCEVYSHALCNIAATGAVDGSDGLFFARDPTVESPYCVEVNLTLEKSKDPSIEFPPFSPSFSGIYELFLSDQWERDLERGALNRRAWVIQERFLSTRVLHFSSTQVFWECLENQASEIFHTAIPEMAQVASVWDIQSLKRNLLHAQKHEAWNMDLLDSWRNFLIKYSKCELSKESDKLMAIHGIQQLVSELTRDTLVCGLWRGRLIEELCWYRSSALHAEKPMSGFCHPQIWHAPSWSWASTNAAIWPGHIAECPEAQNHVTIQAIDIKSLESGQLEHASLSLRGKISNVTSIVRGLSSTERYATEFEYENGMITAGYYRERSLELIFDNLDSDNESQLRDDLVSLKMVSCSCEYSDNTTHKPSLVALILKPNDVVKRQYERVGRFRVQGTFYDFYIQHETNIEQSLVLI